IMVLPDEWEPGTLLADALPLVEDILLVEATGNRPDLRSVYGIAREVAALFDLSLAPPPGRDPERVGEEPVDIRIEDFEGCPRYVGRLFRDVRIGPSPTWLKTRLLDAGMRPISNVVDVTNYVMLALGNPLHAFDHAKLAGGRIVVRRAEPGETLRTLDGVDRKLEPEDLVIADAERAIALIGIETPTAEQRAILERLGFETPGEEVVVPTWRARDVTREVDVIEEIARFRLDEVPFTLPFRRAMFGSLSREQRLRRRVEDVLAGLGFS